MIQPILDWCKVGKGFRRIKLLPKFYFNRRFVIEVAAGREEETKVLCGFDGE